MQVKVTRINGADWNLVCNLARVTIHKDAKTGEPSDEFKRCILDAEHSPIRAMQFIIEMVDIPYWVSVHLVRHKYGVEHYVGTQRSDRTGVPREKMPQDSPVNHTMVMNAMELMFVSRRRLCAQASPDTREVWRKVVDEVRKIDPILAEFCVPMCIYRGGECHEIRSCGRCPPAEN